jgi:hypothetical protein
VQIACPRRRLRRVEDGAEQEEQEGEVEGQEKSKEEEPPASRGDMKASIDTLLGAPFMTISYDMSGKAPIIILSAAHLAPIALRNS